MNRLKQAFADRRPALGLWQALANPYTAEICARAGYDWLMFDAEHAPNTVQTLLAQLQAVAPFPVEPVARPPVGDPAVIKQYLDIGFRTLLIPMVESAQQAERLVAATRFPPAGIRGVASATSRASGFGADPDYLARTHEDICLLVQIESKAALDQIEAIAAVPGVDGLFIGPADLAGSLGFLGRPRDPVVQAAIADALDRIRRCGRPSGIFALDPEDAARRIAEGVAFVSLGTDIGLLSGGAKALLRTCRPPEDSR
jgi:4-hydroxy-2-oxoheptanedioate aldolase